VECTQRGVVVHLHIVGHARTLEGAFGVLARHAKATTTIGLHALIYIQTRKAVLEAGSIRRGVERLFLES
jgi:F0F1-type ATP synthase epsilon subunit